MSEIQLQHPFTVDGEHITHLKLRRPKVKDRIASEQVEGTLAEKELKLMAILCHVSEKVIQEMDLSDYRQLQDKIASYLVQDQS